jgi:hypothetical protein
LALLFVQVIQRIEERIARVSFLPVENGEGLQVLRYEVRCSSACQQDHLQL